MEIAHRFEEFIEDFRNGTYDLTDKGKCTGCGACCSNLLPMTDKEIEVIRKYIKRYRIKEQKRFAPLAMPVLDMTCPFLDDRKKTEKCLIYEVRPEVCRQFICDPKQRQIPDLEYAKSTRIVNVRSEFFNH